MTFEAGAFVFLACLGVTVVLIALSLLRHVFATNERDDQRMILKHEREMFDLSSKH